MPETNNRKEIKPPADSQKIDTGAACLVLLLRFFGIPGDVEAIRHEFGEAEKPLGVQDVLRAARKFGLKSRSIKTTWDRLRKTSLPAIAQTHNGNFFVLGQIAEDKILIQSPSSNKPQTLSRKEFENIWNAEVILVTQRTPILGKGGKFDISWFIPVLLRYKRIFSEVIVASFFLQVFALVSPLFFMVIIDKVLVHRGLTTLDVLVFGLLVVSVFEVLLGLLRTYIFSHTTNRVDVELGAKLFDHLLKLPLSYFQARRTGESIARVRELENIRNFITGSSLTLVIDLFFTFVFFAVMYMFSPTLTWIVLSSIPFYVLLSILVTPVLRRRIEEKFQRGAVNQAFLVESVSGVETLKAMAVEPQMQRRWEDQLAGYVGASFKTTHLGNISGQTAQLISKVTLALTLYFGALMVVEGDLTVGQLVGFNMLSQRVIGPILRLANLWQDFQQARISVDRLGDILNTPTEPRQNINRATMPQIKGFISFEDVIFRYKNDGPEVLRRVSLTVKAGEIIGIVGPSGSGKSTLTKLVQRLYLPESGRVLVDGTDLAMIDTSWLRRQIGVVLQENVLFNRTVRDNIALSDPGMTMERVVAAAKLAGAHDFILELPEGYDTEIGERGNTVSGGQRQRIAIARALVSNPRILIFDEATSALDYESEVAIQKNMRDICKGRTVMIIAHRLSAVRDADRIVTIESGEITEQGTHKELISRGGRYAKLHALQMGASVPQESSIDSEKS
ncbi:MAG: type I secretion system permease/ATPase [Pseudomonadota bacterium]|nr:type I secretion system permease/ATPase [Pseudomonadota bacterium]